MMASTSRILSAVLLLVIFAITKCEGLSSSKCQQCYKASSNAECNNDDGTEYCGKNELCYTLQENKIKLGDKFQISKRCRKRHTCPPVNSIACNDKGNKCYQCCEGDMCNRDVDDFFGASTPTPVDSSKPVASWTFTPSNGGRDLSIKGENPVTLSNITYGTGPNGEADGAAVLPNSFDQAMMVMNPTDALRFTDQMTYFTRIYFTGTKGAIFEYNTGQQERTGDVGSLLWLWYSATSLKVERTGFDIEASDVVEHNRWTDIAIAWNTSSLSFYVDGVLVKLVDHGSANLEKTQTGHLHFGYRPGTAQYFLSGRLACSQFFNVALSADAVQKLTCDEGTQVSTTTITRTTTRKNPPEPIASWTLSSQNGGNDLSKDGQNPITMQNIEYDIGPNGEQDGAAVLPQSFNQSIVVMNPSEKLRFSVGDTMTYFTRIYLTGNKKGAFFEYNTGLREDNGEVGSLLWLWSGDTSLKVERTGFDVQATNVLTHNTWTDIAIVLDTSLLSFYVDGILVKTAEGSLDLEQTQKGYIHFGYRPGSSSYFLSGKLACAQFFDRALDGDEVEGLTCDKGSQVSTPKPVDFSRPVASWTFTSDNGGSDLSEIGDNSVTMTNITYGLGPNGAPEGAAVLPQSFQQSIVVMNPTEKLRFTNAMTYFTRVMMTDTRGAYFEYNTGLRERAGTIGSLLWSWSSRTDLKVERTGFDVEATDVVELNSWNDIAVVWDTSLLSFYVNGKSVKSSVGSLDLEQTQSGNIHFGYRPGNSGYFMSGRLACSQFFDTALTAEEVGDLECD